MTRSTTTPASAERPPSARRFAARLALTILLVALAAYGFRRWLGQEAQFQKLLDREAQALAAADHRTFMALQDWTDPSWLVRQQEAIEWRVYNKSRGDAAAGEPPPRARVIESGMRGTTAWVLVATKRGEDTVRQVTFFRQVDRGWLHAGPSAEFWGEPRRKRTGHLIWHYRERDEGWVAGLLDDGEAMVEQLGQDLQVSSSGPITIEVAYSLSTAQSLYPIAPVLTLASPLMAGVDEQDMRDELALALTQYMSVQASGWRLRWEASSRAALLRSIIAWEATQVTGSGLDDERAGLLAGAVAANELLSLAQVWPDPALPAVGSSDLRYAQGWAAIDYIATRYGRQSVAALLARLEGAASADEALRLALGQADLNQFEPGWVQFMRDKYGRKD